MKKSRFMRAALKAAAVFLFAASFAFIICAEARAATIRSVAVVSLEEPKAGNRPDYVVSLSPGEENYYEIYQYTKDTWYLGAQWLDWTEDPAHGKPMNPNSDTFKAGHRYQFMVLLRAKNGNEFANKNGNLDVDASLNGRKSKVYKAFADDSIHYLGVYYTYNELPDDEISTVTVYDITPPKAGQTPSYSMLIYDNDGYQADTQDTANMRNGIKWYDKTARKWMSPSDQFTAEHTYEVWVSLTAKTGKSFKMLSNGKFDVDARINGLQAETVSSTGDKKHLTVKMEYFCPGDSATISSVSIMDIAEPVMGQKPVYTGTVRNGENYRLGGSGEAMINGVQWYDRTEERWISPEEPFADGHLFFVSLTIIAKDACQFDVGDGHDNGGMTAEVNGQRAYVKASGFKDRIIVCKYFGSIRIDAVSVGNVCRPVHGEQPSYTCDVYGNGFSLNETAGSHGQNGVSWYDKTAQEWMSPNETFLAGHTYRVGISLISDPGYEFSTDSDGRFSVDCELDGMPAYAEYTGNAQKLTLYRDFECRREIREIKVTGIQEPAAGEKPVYTALVHNENCRLESVNSFDQTWINGIRWSDETEQKYLHADDILIEGHVYGVCVSLVSQDDYGFAAWKGKEYISAAVNEEKADDIIDWGSPETNIGIVKRFTCKAAENKNLPGDVNGDGKVDGKDLLRLSRSLAGAGVEISAKNADCNGDGKIDGKDLVRLARYLAGANVELKSSPIP